MGEFTQSSLVSYFHLSCYSEYIQYELLSERTLYSCQLRFIGIYVRVVCVSCICFLRILYGYSILEISENFNVRGSLRFHIQYAHVHNKK